MKTIALLIFTAIVFNGCSKSGDSMWLSHSIQTQDDLSIAVKDIPNEVPRFRREYKAHVTDEVKIKIEIYEWLGINRHGELTQRNGKWVTFEPENVAEKIIDRELVPKVQKYVDAILRIDKQFRDNKPSEFTDEKGVKWKRV